MKKVLIFGASSAIAIATARELAPDGCSFDLCGRQTDTLQTLAAELGILGANHTQVRAFDALQSERHDELLQEILEQGQPDLILLAWGELPDQQACEQGTGLTTQMLALNGSSTVVLLNRLLQKLNPSQSTTIAALGSPAGLRGRQANYTYGAGKAMLMTFAEGARARFTDTAIHIMTVIPGRVDTPMTADFDKGPLWTSPEQVARCLIKGVQKGVNVVYAPAYWRWILLVIRLLPETLLRRLKA